MRSPLAQQGFALPVTLITLAVLLSAAAAFAAWVERAVERTGWIADEAAARQAVHSTVSRFRYAVQTRAMGGMGLSTLRPTSIQLEAVRGTFGAPLLDPQADILIRLDGMPYRTEDGATARFLDEGGLISLTALNPEPLRDWLTGRDLPRARVDRLMDVLADYQDPDALLRLNGAERVEYMEAGLKPPANRELVSPFEILAMPGWRELAGGDERHLPLDRLTIYRAGMPNLNTSPTELLGGTGILLDGEAAMLSEARPFTDISGASAAIGRPLTLDPTRTRWLPSTTFRVLIEHPGLAGTWATSMELHTKSYNGEPWSTQWTVRDPETTTDDHAGESEAPLFLAAEPTS